MKKSVTVFELQHGHDFQLKITKGHNFVKKNVGGDLAFNLCTSSAHALYLYEFS